MFFRCFLFLFFYLQFFTLHAETVYLTWKGDPSTTMTVMWLTTTGQEAPDFVQYQMFGQRSWKKQEGSASSLKKTSITIHQTELKNLEPDSEYAFRVGEGEIRTFRTLPKDLSSRPLKVAVGGDAYYGDNLYHKMNLEVRKKDPDFAIVAGDIVYAQGLRYALRSYGWKAERWLIFFKLWSKDMVTKEGRMIPIVPVLGNHDVKEGFDNPHKTQVFFYEFFVFPVKGVPFQVMEFGRDLCFFLLDSGHTYPVGGMQTEWLESKLKQHAKTLYKIPIYHIGAYPSTTSYRHRAACDIRKFWVPLFEQYGVKISMEHDSHAFKKTHPLWKGMIDPKGILYLGDGAWGVPPLKPKKHWYLEKALQTNCYWFLTIDRSTCKAVAYDIEGHALDRLTVPAQPQ